MSKFIHIFPLSIFKDRIVLDAEYKRELIELIFAAESASAEARKGYQGAWLGDTRGHEFLFKKEAFGELHRQLAKKVIEYTEALGINNRLIDFYFQRSWATISRKGEQIHEHCHEQSNISFAYYLLRPADSGGINFITYNHPNEISTGIFTPSKHELGFIQRPSMLTWNVVHLEPAEDEILVFPSKTLHSTSPSESDQPRISISADITTMLRDSRGHETMMPHFSNWRSFDSFS
jgi:uncharacterized protein (TIGR02466 family)